MLESIKDELTISLSSIKEIRTSIANEIKYVSRKRKLFEENITRERIQDLMNVRGHNFEVPEQRNCPSDHEGSHKINTKNISLSTKCKDFESSGNSKITSCTFLTEPETKQLPNETTTNVLRRLQMQLKNTLKCVEFLRQGVTEKITLVNKENQECSDNKSLCNSSKVLQNSSISEKTYGIRINKNDNSNFHNVESEQTNSDLVKCNTNHINCDTLPDKSKKLDNLSDIKMEPSDNIHTSNNLPLRNSNNIHENIMISLISDDDSNSDCSVISISYVDHDGSVTDTSTVQSDLQQSIKSENTSLHEEQSTLVSHETNQNGSIETNCEINKRKSDSSDKQNIKRKKRRKSKENGMITDGSTVNNIFGKFYKVKLTNLHESSSYADIASILENAGLEFVDILLMNCGSRSYAEVSFIDSTTREKAISLDKSLSHLGLKIKIRPL